MLKTPSVLTVAVQLPPKVAEVKVAQERTAVCRHVAPPKCQGLDVLFFLKCI